MSAPLIILASLPSFCQKSSKLVEISQSSDKYKFAQFFFETRCIFKCEWFRMSLNVNSDGKKVRRIPDLIPVGCNGRPNWHLRYRIVYPIFWLAVIPWMRWVCSCPRICVLWGVCLSVCLCVGVQALVHGQIHHLQPPYTRPQHVSLALCFTV